MRINMYALEAALTVITVMGLSSLSFGASATSVSPSQEGAVLSSVVGQAAANHAMGSQPMAAESMRLSFTQEALEKEPYLKLIEFDYLPLAVSKAAGILRLQNSTDSERHLVSAFQEWVKAQRDGRHEVMQIEAELAEAVAAKNDHEAERLTSLRSSKDDEIQLATDVLKMEIENELGDEKADDFLNRVIAAARDISAELLPTEKLNSLKNDAFSQMNAAIQMMNAAATQSKQRSALSPDKVAALRKELEFLVARYTEVINLMKQNQGSTK